MDEYCSSSDKNQSTFKDCTADFSNPNIPILWKIDNIKNNPNINKENYNSEERFGFIFLGKNIF